MNQRQKVLKILVVDDHPVVREGLRAMLSSDPSLKVIGEAASGEEALEKVAQLQPQVVLTDIRMPGMNGIEVTRRVKEVHPSVAVIVLTMYDSEMYVVEAIRAGAAGYLTKDSSSELLCHTVKAVIEGATMVRSSLLRRAVQGLLPLPRQPQEGESTFVMRGLLTARELEVLHLIAQGRTNREIARSLNLAEITVKKYVQSIMGKLGASDRTQAAIKAVRLELVQ